MTDVARFDPIVGKLLAKRLVEARATSTLRQLLKDSKQVREFKRGDFRTSVNSEQLIEQAELAIAKGYLSTEQLASAVDEMESNGGQHIFLYQLKEESRASVPADLVKQLPRFPRRPTAALYTAVPSAPTIGVVERADGRIEIKQVSRATYWESHEDTKQRSADREVWIKERKERRAVCIALVDPSTGLVEIRVDRVRDRDDKKLSLTLLLEFADSLKPALDLQQHLEPHLFFDQFSKMARDSERTFMTVDDALDSSANYHLSSRREDRYARDIRLNPKYTLGSEGVQRDALNIFYQGEPPPAQSDDDQATMEDGEIELEHDTWAEAGMGVHLVMSKEVVAGKVVGKIYVAARVPKERLDDAIAWIQSFA